MVKNRVEARAEASAGADLTAVIAEIQESALDPARWRGVLELLAGRVGGHKAILRTFEATPETGGLWVTYGIKQFFLDEYARHYQTRDVWEGGARRKGLLTAGRVLTGDIILPRREFLASEFYRDFLRCDDIHDLLALVLHDGSRPPMPMTVLSVFRSHSQPVYGSVECEIAGRCMPHLARAVELNFRSVEMRLRSTLQGVALEHFAPAIIYLGRDDTVLHVNPAAGALLDARDGLKVEGGKLVAAPERDNEGPQNARPDPDARVTAPSEVSRYVRPSGKLPYVGVRVWLAHDEDEPRDARRPWFALLLHDPAAAADHDFGLVARLYRLTPAESRVLQMLVRYGSAKAIFHHTDLNENTVRGQLKSILRKTGTHAQAELIRLALTSDLAKHSPPHSPLQAS